ncbi:hypothetical protein L0663_25745 [Dyadobacter sp. CY107]|uniref:hypothetical protein n=1 Tax=Dyadobacter fanqingshengii TaxID=2906443 RepID=UPI001F21D9E8|nr:hypothetical protein [Dyadobacter fanqingshengii]MCF2506821.1 hypothetical protein [Dyadobacter fanqingshengii]
MKRITLQFSSLLAALFLFAFSCQDHRDPDPEPIAEDARVRTLEITNPGQVINDLNFRLYIETLGTEPITEYGILLSFKSTNSDEFAKVPTLGNKFSSPLKFEYGATAGEHIHLQESVGFDDFETLYYRAYAKTENGKVVYGDPMEYTPLDVPKFGSFTLSKSENVPATAKLEVVGLGTVQVEEYGVAYSYRTAPSGAVNVSPKLADRTVPYKLPVSVSAHAVNLPIKEGKFDKLYARPFMRLKNAKIYYGSVKSL